MADLSTYVPAYSAGSTTPDSSKVMGIAGIIAGLLGTGIGIWSLTRQSKAEKEQTALKESTAGLAALAAGAVTKTELLEGKGNALAADVNAVRGEVTFIKGEVTAIKGDVSLVKADTAATRVAMEALVKAVQAGQARTADAFRVDGADGDAVVTKAAPRGGKKPAVAAA